MKLVATLIVLFAASIAVGNDKPNVLFIISDDLTAEALGCYGNAQCKTPHIDKLASRGVRFDRAYCQFPVCGPSRAAIMSGMYPEQIGVIGNGASSKFTQAMGKRPSMAEHFKRNGYHTARVSKIYHMRVPGDITAGVNGPDHAASWTQRFNCKGPEQWTKGMHEHLSPGIRLKPDPDRTIHYGLGYGPAFYVVKASDDAARQPDAQAADKASELLRERAKDGKPFFLAVGLIRPHVPLVAPASYFDPYPAEDMKLAPRIDDDLADIPRVGMSANEKSFGMTTQAQQRKALSAYYAAVAFMDAQVGRLLATLEETGLAKNTIVVFCSDHGWHLGEHTLWQKMSLHEESARIPLMIAGPGIEAGVTKSLVEQIDLYPTLAELAGLEVPAHCMGESLVRVLRDNDSTVRDAAYCIRGRQGRLLRTDRWAFMDYGNNQRELYDMEKDPNQYANLAGDPAHADMIRQLGKQLAAKIETMDVKIRP